MMDFGYVFQRVLYYMANPDQKLPVASDIGQAAEIEKMRKAISDLGEGRRNVLSEYQGIATETLLLEIARQITIDQQRNGGYR